MDVEVTSCEIPDPDDFLFQLISSSEGLGIGLEVLGICMELFIPEVCVCLSYRSPTLIPWRCYWQLGALKGENPVPVLHPVVQQVVSSL